MWRHDVVSPDVAQEIRLHWRMGPESPIAGLQHSAPVIDACVLTGGPLLFGGCGNGWARERWWPSCWKALASTGRCSCRLFASGSARSCEKWMSPSSAEFVSLPCAPCRHRDRLSPDNQPLPPGSFLCKAFTSPDTVVQSGLFLQDQRQQVIYRSVGLRQIGHVMRDPLARDLRAPGVMTGLAGVQDTLLRRRPSIAVVLRPRSPRQFFSHVRNTSRTAVSRTVPTDPLATSEVNCGAIVCPTLESHAHVDRTCRRNSARPWVYYRVGGKPRASRLSQSRATAEEGSR